MKVFHLFFLLFLCTGCTNLIQERADLLDKELAVTPILSLSFDSILQDVRRLPPQQQVAVLLQISSRDEGEIDGLLKQKELLFEGFSLASKKERKKVLLRLLELYGKLDDLKYLNADIKGLQLSNDIETNYSLTPEEDWKIKMIKVALLNRRGLHEQYLPIWFELLADHRAAGKPEFVIEDLFAIANQFAILGDQEKGISLYKEAYLLATENNLSDLSNQCLARLIYLFYDLKQYSEVINYSNKIGVDTVALFIPSVYSLLSTCYLELQKPDSARLYLTQMDQTLKTGKGMIVNCSIANTYMAENRIDSALVFLDKAMRIFQHQTEQLQEKNIKASLPFCFLPSYSSLATLYQQDGNYLQASKSLTLVEPLMKKSIKNPAQLEIQANALTRYSSFCRATKQYEKAVDLLIRRDSIQQIINKAYKERDNKNFIDRLRITDLMHTIKLQKIELIDSQRLLAAIAGCAFLSFSLIAAIFYIIHQRRKRLNVIINQEKEIERFRSSVTPESKKTLSQQEILFRTVKKRVRSEKLFLDKTISLKTLAEKLDTNRTYLSSCINTCSGVNFNQWINDFRIDYLLERIHSGEKLATLAEEAGFISADSFYRNFKRKTNLTPNEYLRQHSFK